MPSVSESVTAPAVGTVTWGTTVRQASEGWNTLSMSAVDQFGRVIEAISRAFFTLPTLNSRNVSSALDVSARARILLSIWAYLT